MKSPVTSPPASRSMAQSSDSSTPPARPRPARRRVVQGEKLRGADKVAHIPVKVIDGEQSPPKPDWIRVKVPAGPEVSRIKQLLRRHRLASVCEEAQCPDRKSTRLNSSHVAISYAVFCLKKKKY